MYRSFIGVWSKPLITLIFLTIGMVACDFSKKNEGTVIQTDSLSASPDSTPPPPSANVQQTETPQTELPKVPKPKVIEDSSIADTSAVAPQEATDPKPKLKGKNKKAAAEAPTATESKKKKLKNDEDVDVDEN